MPCNGSVDLTFKVVRSTSAEHVGAPTDPDEAARIEWIPIDDLPLMLRDGELGDGMAVMAVLAELAGV